MEAAAVAVPVRSVKGMLVTVRFTVYSIMNILCVSKTGPQLH